MEPFFDKWTAGGGTFSPSRPDSLEFSDIPPVSKARKFVDDAVQCINCGICYAACDIVQWKPDYLGPAALNRAWTLVNDERNQENSGLRKALASDSGCLSCHTTRSCTRHCPKQLNPSASIAGLKRMAVQTVLNR